MSFNIKIPFVISTHIKKFSSTASLKNKTKAAAIGMVAGVPVFHDGNSVLSLYGGQTKLCTTQFDAVTGTTGVTLTDIVGLTGFACAAAAKYVFEINLSTITTVNCGIKVGLGYTTMTTASLDASSQGYAAAAVAAQHTTVATTGMTLFGQTAAIVLGVRIFGSFTTTLAGTFSVQGAQNAAHADTTSVFVGSWATISRIA